MSSSAVREPVPISSPSKLRAWIPTLLWLCVLTAFSSDTFSAENTGSILMKVVHALFGSISSELFQHLHFLIRKSAHFCSYGLLSAFAFFSWRATFPAPARWTLRWSLLGLLTAVIAGGMDEFHQIFVPSRTASLRDVFIDTTGAICFQLAIALWLHWRNARSRE